MMHCYQILENDCLIRTLQSWDKAGETGVYNCLKKVFHETLINRLIKPGKGLPGPDTQKLIAEEAFQEAFIILLKNTRTGHFEAMAQKGRSAGSVSYFFSILWNTFQNELKRKYNRNFYSLDERVHGRRVEMSADLPVYNRKDGLLTILHTAIRMLNDKCSQYMQWQYMDGKDTEDIILRAADAPGTVKKDLSNCREKLQEKVKELCSIDF